MINDKMRSEVEQGTAGMVELLGLFFRSLITDGFTEPQAMKLTCTYLTAVLHKPSDSKPE